MYSDIPEMKRRAKELRNNMTEEERHLWYDFLRNYPVRFKKQVAIDFFVMDFYSPSAKLCIEIDGSQHYTEQGLAYDTERTAILEGHGIKVIRFSNEDINMRFAIVCETIINEIEARLKGNPPAGDAS